LYFLSCHLVCSSVLQSSVLFIITDYLTVSRNICASTPNFVWISSTGFSLWPAVVCGRWSVCIPEVRQPSRQRVPRFYSAPYPTVRM
jgi:hypothetical protein